MKILHLERKFIEATETFIANQINALSKDTTNFVFTLEHLDNLEVDTEVVVPPYDLRSNKYLSNKFKKYFIKKEKEVQPDFIHAHFITDACLFHSFTKNINVPKIVSCYGYDVTEVPVKFKYLYRYFYKKAIAEYDCFLAMSEDMKADLMKIGVPEEKIVVHYHGINTKNFQLDRGYELKDNTLQLLTVSSLREKKGHETVLNALKALKENNIDIKFKYNIVGSGSLETKFKDFVKNNNLEDEVIFHGLIKHGDALKKLIAKADVFVHPSVTTKTNDKEGIPGAIVEAMASGLPVISTYHAGIPAVIKHEVNGLLIEERDAKQMANYISELYKNDAKRKQLGQKALTFAAENLDFMHKAEDLKNIYRQLAKNKAK